VPDAWRSCREVLARHSRSFDLASRLLPPSQRDEVAALYAWCRTCDDAVDLLAPEDAAAGLERLRHELHAIHAGAPQDDPVRACFQEVLRRRKVPIDYPLELLEGMAADLGPVRYERVDDLLLYAWRVAGTVGLMMCHVLGVSDPRAGLHAAHLGIGMQLTNVCRDVAEDWERGRVYLPAELLEPELVGWLATERQARPATPLPPWAGTGIAGAVRRLLALADRYYASADVGMAWLEPRAALAVRTARRVYAEIGREIEARDCDVLAGRAVVAGPRKLRLAAGALRRYLAERRRHMRPGPMAPPGVLHGAEAVRLG